MQLKTKRVGGKTYTTSHDTFTLALSQPMEWTKFSLYLFMIRKKLVVGDSLNESPVWWKWKPQRNPTQASSTRWLEVTFAKYTRKFELTSIY